MAKNYHNYCTCRTTWEYRHIFVPIAAFWQRFFQTLLMLNIHLGVTVYHTLTIFFTINAKDLIVQNAKFWIHTLKLNVIFWDCKKIKADYFWTWVDSPYCPRWSIALLCTHVFAGKMLTMFVSCVYRKSEFGISTPPGNPFTKMN